MTWQIFMGRLRTSDPNLLSTNIRGSSCCASRVIALAQNSTTNCARVAVTVCETAPPGRCDPRSASWLYMPCETRVARAPLKPRLSKDLERCGPFSSCIALRGAKSFLVGSGYGNRPSSIPNPNPDHKPQYHKPETGEKRGSAGLASSMNLWNTSNADADAEVRITGIWTRRQITLLASCVLLCTAQRVSRHAKQRREGLFLPFRPHLVTLNVWFSDE